MSSPTILLGYELATGRAVRIPLRHMAVTGITQMSGKTTTLEALIGRSGLRAVTFITKRGEGSFGGDTPARTIPAYFRPGCGWQEVVELLEVCTGKRVSDGMLPYVMRACNGLPPEEKRNGNTHDLHRNQRKRPRLRNVGTGNVDSLPAMSDGGVRPIPRMQDTDATEKGNCAPKSLSEVAANLLQLEAEADGKAEANRLLLLCGYFTLTLAQVELLPTTGQLELHAGLNCMDLSSYPVALQALVIAATLDHINQCEAGVVVLIPEAWQFIPREGHTACKAAVERMARKGACLDNYLWIDSQDLAGIDIVARKAVSCYLLGVQREANEVQRTLKHLPADVRKPSARGIMELRRGEFWAAWDAELHPVYVQPAWLDDDPERARSYAMYSHPESFVARPAHAVSLRRPSRRENRGKSKSTALPAVSDSAPITGRVQ